MQLARKSLSIFIIFATIILTISCGEEVDNRTENDNTNTEKVVVDTKVPFKFNTPIFGSFYTSGEDIDVSLKIKDTTATIDSIRILIKNKHIKTLYNKPFEISLSSKDVKVGATDISAVLYSNNKTNSEKTSVVILSDIIPTQYTYKIKNTYNHDKNAYTQGLMYEDGIFYEGTGQYGESSLRKVKIETGEVLSSLNMPADVFGEGIVVFKDKIIQLTWKSAKGFVYNKENFNLQTEFYYPTQGWGITTDGKELIMSDGSEKIYYMDPTSYVESHRFEVYDNKGPIYNLNELEYINGDIYANVYGYDYIVIIDPETGKVKGKIDLSNILSKKDITSKIDVLNGIAYDKKGDRIFVTGKWWPKVFEIDIVEK